MSKRGNCYATCEALYHLLGGKKAGYKPMRLRMKPSDNECHWFLLHKSGTIIDPTRKQFGHVVPEYKKGIGSGFLTKKPSKRARALMKIMVWQ